MYPYLKMPHLSCGSMAASASCCLAQGNSFLPGAPHLWACRWLVLISWSHSVDEANINAWRSPIPGARFYESSSAKSRQRLWLMGWGRHLKVRPFQKGSLSQALGKLGPTRVILRRLSMEATHLPPSHPPWGRFREQTSYRTLGLPLEEPGAGESVWALVL